MSKLSESKLSVTPFIPIFALEGNLIQSTAILDLFQENLDSKYQKVLKFHVINIKDSGWSRVMMEKKILPCQKKFPFLVLN